MKQQSHRAKITRHKVMPNGNIHFYREDGKKSSCSEAQSMNPENVCDTITTAHEPKIYEHTEQVIQIGNIFPDGAKFNNRQRGRIYSQEGLSPSLQTMQGGNLEPKILSYSRDDKGKIVGRHANEIANTIHGATGGGGNTDQYIIIPLDRNPQKPNSEYAPTIRAECHGNLPCVAEPQIVAMRGREEAILTPRRTAYGRAIRKEYDNHEVAEKRKNVQQLEPRTDGVTNTLTSVQKDNLLYQNLRIRKLTERECFRLMGVDEADIDKIRDSGVSRSQQYKMAGNSIVVDVLYHIFRKMFTETQCETNQLKLF